MTSLINGTFGSLGMTILIFSYNSLFIVSVNLHFNYFFWLKIKRFKPTLVCIRLPLHFFDTLNKKLTFIIYL